MAATLISAELRSRLRSRWPWIGLGVGIMLALPNFAWQVANGFPTLTYISNHSADISQSGGIATFLANFFLYIGPVVLPLWIAGWFVLFGDAHLRPIAVMLLVAILVLLPEGEAGALDIYGQGRGAPQVLSPQLSFWYWKLDRVSATTLLTVGYAPGDLGVLCGHVERVAMVVIPARWTTRSRGRPSWCARTCAKRSIRRGRRSNGSTDRAASRASRAGVYACGSRVHPFVTNARGSC